MLRNGLWSTAGSLSTALLVTVAGVVTARLLGPEDFGVYVYAVFVYAAASQLAVWGLPGAVTRFVATTRAAGDAGAERAVVSRGVLAAAGGSAAASVALVAASFAGVLPRSPSIVLAALVVLSLGPIQVLVSLLSGRERFRALALWQMGTGVLNPALTVAVLVAGGSVLAVLTVDVITTAVGLAVLWLVARPVHLRRRQPPPPGFWRYTTAYAGLIVLGIVVFQRSEILILERFGTSSDVALYGVAFGLAQLVVRLTGPALGVLTPAFARLQGQQPEHQQASVQRAVDLAVLLGACLSGVGAVLAQSAVVLLYGERYSGAGVAAALLLSVSWLVLVNGVLTAVAQAGAHMRVLVLVNGVAAVFNIVSGIVLIAAFGVVGAAVANASAQSAVTLGVVLWARRHLPAVHYRSVVRVLPATAGGVAAAWLARSLPYPADVLVGGLLGIVAFGLVASVTGAADQATRNLLRRLLPRRRR